MKKVIFGPVASRRLGRSLGVDLVPYKHCTYDCIYCQLGSTTVHSLKRGVFVDSRETLKQVEEFLSDRERVRSLDVITLAGSGEPTLAENFGQVIRWIKDLTPIPVVVLTNGSLMDLKEVRDDLMAADVVIPSVDAVTQEVFEKINRPVPGINLDAILEGLRRFSSVYRGKLLLEVMVIAGINDSETCMKKIAAYVAGLNPDQVQLNCSVRPVTNPGALSPPMEKMEQLAGLFPASVKVNLVGTGTSLEPGKMDIGLPVEELILAHLTRRPGTPGDVAAGIEAPLGEVQEMLERLAEEGRVKCMPDRTDNLYFLSRKGEKQ